MNSSRSVRLQADLVRRAALCLMVAVAAGTVAGGQSPNLREAVRTGNTPAVRALLQKRVDVNAADADGTTALHWAVRANDAETVKALLKAGANANAVNAYGVTPLFLAATNSTPDGSQPSAMETAFGNVGGPITAVAGLGLVLGLLMYLRSRRAKAARAARTSTQRPS